MSKVINEVPIEQLLEIAVNKYKTLFKSTPTVAGCAPGRVNLLGEHTDYNDGYVFPMALPFVTLVVGGPNNHNKCFVHTLCTTVGDEVEVYFPPPSIEPLKPGGHPHWANYVKGVVALFPGEVPSFDALIISTVPTGSGLSSSAALEVAVYTFLEELTGQYTKDLKEKAYICQKAEHDFGGVPCGIMDQMTSVMAKEDHVILLDCRTKEINPIPLSDPGLAILITDTGVKHSLANSEYPIRKAQCQDAASILEVKSLRDASFCDLEAHSKDPKMTSVLFKRAKHVIKEISRTYHGAKALQSKDYGSFGLLMCQSHFSLRDDYEVSCAELDKVVDISMSCDGVYGCRMTGGGFGGCTVALVKNERVSSIIESIAAQFPENEPTFYIAKASEPAKGFCIKL